MIHISAATCTQTLSGLTAYPVYRVTCGSLTCTNTVYGSNGYRADSSICAAARHAGLLNSTSQILTLQVLQYTSYTGSTAHGITSLSSSGAATYGFNIRTTISACRNGFLCNTSTPVPCPIGYYVGGCSIAGYQCDSSGNYGTSLLYPYQCLVADCPTSCLPCPSGSSCVEGVRTICHAGQYGLGGSSCYICYPGSVSTLAGSSSCSCCSAGYIAGPSRTSCHACPSGEYTLGNCDRCKTCPNTTICPCLVNSCPSLRTCINTPGTAPGYICGGCPSGYQLSGSACVDINECLSAGCPANTVCKNIQGGFSCDCNLGYLGSFSGTGVAAFSTISSQTCADYNECTNNNGGCHPLRACVNTAGSFYCDTCVSTGLNVYVNDGPFGCLLQTPTFTLTGVVIDAVTAVKIKGAIVTINNLGVSQVTDVNGAFTMAALPGNVVAYTIICNAVGYYQSIRELAIVQTGQSISFQLSGLLNTGKPHCVLIFRFSLVNRPISLRAQLDRCTKAPSMGRL